MIHRRGLVLAALAVVLGSGCSFEVRRTTTRSSPLYIWTDFPPCTARGWGLATPVAGMFVGVSKYGDEARVYSTAAHRVGAVAFHSPFRVAANNSPEELGNAVALHVLVDLYRPPDAQTWIHPARAFAGGWGASDEPVTRERIAETLEKTLAAGETLHTEHGRVLLVIYVAAHGWIHSDGEAYVVPADGDANAPETWISYRSLIGAAADFVGGDLDAGRRALVVLDACQFERHEGVSHDPVPAPPGVLVVRAAAPGQYAWHWTSTSTATQEIYGTTGYRISFPVKPRGPERGVIEREAHSKMSVVPIGTECGLKDASDRQELLLSDWAEGLTRRASAFLDKIPDIERYGLRQEIQIDYGEGSRDVPIFRREEAPE